MNLTVVKHAQAWPHQAQLPQLRPHHDQLALVERHQDKIGQVYTTTDFCLFFKAPFIFEKATEITGRKENLQKKRNVNIRTTF